MQTTQYPVDPNHNSLQNQNGGKRMWRHIGYEMFREKKERKSQKEGIRRKRETGKHSKKVCCNRVAKPV